MRTTTFLLLTLAALAGCQQHQEPTAKELFELRGQCGALAEKAMKDQAEVSAIQGFPYIHSHFDPKTNRCLLRTNTFPVNGPGTGGIWLSDAQSKTVLAGCNKQTSGAIGACMIGDKEKSWQEVAAYIDTMMGEDK
jgi:hypothetical protein